MVKSNNNLGWQAALQQQKFSWAKFVFELLAQEIIHLPMYKGSALRGGFGNAFRQVCCTVKSQECRNCILKQSCPYAYIFETPNNNTNFDADYYPHPFVIEPPGQDKTTYELGETLSFSLILFGKGIPFLPYFIYAFDQLGRTGLGAGKGKFILQNVLAVESLNSDETKEIYNFHSGILKGDYKVWELQEMSKATAPNPLKSIQIQLLTPLRIAVKGKLVNKLSFELFLRTLLRRISLVGKMHCDGEWELPYQEILQFAHEKVNLVEENTHWFDWERYSNRQKKRMKLGGLLGIIVFKGELDPFSNLLTLGQYTHLGKNTSFGLGKYVIGLE